MKASIGIFANGFSDTLIYQKKQPAVKGVKQLAAKYALHGGCAEEIIWPNNQPEQLGNPAGIWVKLQSLFNTPTNIKLVLTSWATDASDKWLFTRRCL